MVFPDGSISLSGTQKKTSVPLTPPQPDASLLSLPQRNSAFWGRSLHGSIPSLAITKPSVTCETDKKKVLIIHDGQNTK